MQVAECACAEVATEGCQHHFRVINGAGALVDNARTPDGCFEKRTKVLQFILIAFLLPTIAGSAKEADIKHVQSLTSD